MINFWLSQSVEDIDQDSAFAIWANHMLDCAKEASSDLSDEEKRIIPKVRGKCGL